MTDTCQCGERREAHYKTTGPVIEDGERFLRLGHEFLPVEQPSEPR